MGCWAPLGYDVKDRMSNSLDPQRTSPRLSTRKAFPPRFLASPGSRARRSSSPLAPVGAAAPAGWSQRLGEKYHTGDIAAGPVEGRNEAILDGVAIRRPPAHRSPSRERFGNRGQSFMQLSLRRCQSQEGRRGIATTRSEAVARWRKAIMGVAVENGAPRSGQQPVGGGRRRGLLRSPEGFCLSRLSPRQHHYQADPSDRGDVAAFLMEQPGDVEVEEAPEFAPKHDYSRKRLHTASRHPLRITRGSALISTATPCLRASCGTDDPFAPDRQQSRHHHRP